MQPDGRNPGALFRALRMLADRGELESLAESLVYWWDHMTLPDAVKTIRAALSKDSSVSDGDLRYAMARLAIGGKRLPWDVIHDIK